MMEAKMVFPEVTANYLLPNADLELYDRIKVYERIIF